ncbi:MAG TPA: phosphatidylglycerol lysyltransferase domain-containing protein [Solirubrobacteraceae bacterium]
MADQIRFLTVRRSAAVAVSVVAVDAILSGLAHAVVNHDAVAYRGWLPPETHLVSIIVGLALLTLVPRLLRGTRTALSVATAGICVLAALSAATDHWWQVAVQLTLCLLLMRARRAFPLGSRNRPRRTYAAAALGAWMAAYGALRLVPLVHVHLRHIVPALHHGVVVSRLSGAWLPVIEVLIGCAALISALALRSLMRPQPAENGHAEHEYRAAKAIVERHGRDSLSPFILRPDKALQFAAGGVLSYRVVGGTAIVSSDPVAPDGAAADALASFLPMARARGWQVALWAASARHLEDYRRLGLHALCVGEEAFVDPSRFTLEGRPVRKLRQSVHRVARRGWQITVCEGRAIDLGLEQELEQLEARWREAHPHLLGFAMSTGAFGTEVGPDDVYAIARGPEGELGAVMRFFSHCGNLSLDTMRRVGETPNGLNEALVAHTLEYARDHGVPEVSLNYAGLAHVLRARPPRNPLRRFARGLALAVLRRHFQMDRLVRFNDKFSPEWRPRYLVYESRLELPRSIVHVLQAEGYLPELRRPRLRRPGTVLPRPLAGRAQARPG